VEQRKLREEKASRERIEREELALKEEIERQKVTTSKIYVSIFNFLSISLVPVNVQNTKLCCA